MSPAPTAPVTIATSVKAPPDRTSIRREYRRSVRWFDDVSRRRILLGAACEALAGISMLGAAIGDDLGILSLWPVGWGLLALLVAGALVARVPLARTASMVVLVPALVIAGLLLTAGPGPGLTEIAAICLVVSGVASLFLLGVMRFAKPFEGE